jgi:hypothetical protein
MQNSGKDVFGYGTESSKNTFKRETLEVFSEALTTGELAKDSGKRTGASSESSETIEKYFSSYSVL